jgi:hypothetical protein
LSVDLKIFAEIQNFFTIGFMKIGEFRKRFELASCFCRDFTRRHITEQMPDAIRFNFTLAKGMKESGKVNFAGRDFSYSQLVSASPADAVNCLFSEEKIPFWIDLYIDGFDIEYTYIAVTFSGDFTDEEELLYNKSSHLPPFNIIGPTIPKNWSSLEKDGKFSFIPFS